MYNLEYFKILIFQQFNSGLYDEQITELIYVKMALKYCFPQNT